MNRDKHIWEGWTVGDFIDDLEVTYKYQSFKSRDEIKKWCKSEQPYYKKHITFVFLIWFVIYRVTPIDDAVII